MIIGYFGRPFNKNHKSLSTKTHIIDGNKVLCSYKPHKTLKFQWCKFLTGINDNFELSYCECQKCKGKYRRLFNANISSLS